MRYLIFAFLLFWTEIAFSQPKLVYETLTHDFGQVPEGTPLTYTFTFKNAGEEPLFIKVKPG